jgi:REase_AHJR-like protein
MKDELEEVAEQYRKDGYQVLLRPSGTDLPAFLNQFEPDLIARNASESVVVEVKPKADLSKDHALAYLAAKVNAQPGWRFDLVVTNHETWPDEIPGDSTERSASEIRSLARTAEKLIVSGELEAASLIAWSAAEAAMREAARRRTIPLETNDPQFVLKTLYSEGVLSRSDYDQLQEAWRIRNAVAHGLELSERRPQVPRFLVDVVERLLDGGPSGKKRKLRRAGSPG